MFSTYLDRVWVQLSIILSRTTRENTWEKALTQAGIANSPEANWLACLYNKNLGQSWGLMRAIRKGLRWSWATSGELERARRLGLCPTSSHVPRSRHNVTVLDEFKACQYSEEQELELLRWNPHSQFLREWLTEGEQQEAETYCCLRPPVLLISSH